MFSTASRLLLVDFAVYSCLMNGDSKGECIVVTSLTRQQSSHKSDIDQRYRTSQDLQYEMHDKTSSIVPSLWPYCSSWTIITHGSNARAKKV